MLGKSWEALQAKCSEQLRICVSKPISNPAQFQHNLSIALPGYVVERSEVTPPAYAISSYMRSLREGNPDDKISVPVIHRTHRRSLGDYLP